MGWADRELDRQHNAKRDRRKKLPHPKWRARYGVNGSKLTSDEARARRDLDKSQGKEPQESFCCGCNKPLILTSEDESHGIVEAAKELLAQAPRNQSHYRHFGKGHPNHPSEGCEFYRPNDPRFADLKSYPVDPEVRKKIEVAIYDPQQRRLNAVVLGELMLKLRGTPITKEDRKRMWKRSRSKILRKEWLAKFPSALPFLLMLGDLPQKRTNAQTDKSYYVQYRKSGTQFFQFTNSHNQNRVVEIPKQIEGNVVYQAPTGIIKYYPMKYPQMAFDVSEVVYRRLANLPRIVPEPDRVVEVPIVVRNPKQIMPKSHAAWEMLRDVGADVSRRTPSPGRQDKSGPVTKNTLPKNLDS